MYVCVLYVCVHMYVCVCMYVCIHVHVRMYIIMITIIIIVYNIIIIYIYNIYLYTCKYVCRWVDECGLMDGQMHGLILYSWMYMRTNTPLWLTFSSWFYFLLQC